MRNTRGMAPPQEPREDGHDQPLVRAAEYVRMSTDHQQYSTENQAETIREYAQRHGLLIVRSYADEGKSGLRLEGRDQLQQLIADVESGAADFQVVLVYDVSRWGRFQDADESAYYEYICKRAGIAVHYCAEQFANDGSPVSTIVKGVKRAMAGEYSRELSVKVFAGQLASPAMGSGGCASTRTGRCWACFARRAEEPADRQGDPGPGTGGRDRHGRAHLPAVLRRRS